MKQTLGPRALRSLAWLGLCLLCTQVPDGNSATVRQLVEVTEINNVSVSPDGRLVAFRTEQASIERNTYDTVWYVQPVDGAAYPRRLGEGGEMLTDGGGSSLPEPVVWSPDSRWIYFRAAHDARIDLWRASVDGERTEQLTHELGNVRAFTLSIDGRLLDYSVGPPRQAVADAELAEYDQGIHINRDVAPADGVFRSGFHEGRLATQRLRNSVEFVTLLADTPDQWKRLDLQSGLTVGLSADSPQAVAPALHASKAIPGQAIAITQEAGARRIAIVSRDMDAPPDQPADLLLMLPSTASRRPVRCTAPACAGKRISGVAWRPGSDEVVFTVSERTGGLQQSVYRWNVLDGQVRLVVQSRGQITGGGRWSPAPCAASLDALLCVAADDAAPPRLERIEIETGTRTLLYDPNRALAQDMRSVQVRDLSWSDAGGMRVDAKYFPASARQGRPPPLFIVYYRCTGFLRGSVGDEWPLVTLAEKGIATLCINANAVRDDDDALARYGAGLEAVESAVRLLAEQGEIDPARVGMGGLSFGAEVTLWVAMHSDLLHAVSLGTPVMSPQMSFLMSLGGQQHFDRMQRYWQVGEPEQTPERWQALSPASNLDRIHAPVLMQMSEQEYRYGLDYAIPLLRQGRADLYVFANEPHQKFQPRHKLAVYQRNLDWFRFWLLDEEDKDPRKAAQYDMWRKMRGVGEHRAPLSGAR